MKFNRLCVKKVGLYVIQLTLSSAFFYIAKLNFVLLASIKISASLRCAPYMALHIYYFTVLDFKFVPLV